MANFKEHGRLQMTPDAWEACLYALDVFFYGSNSSIQPVKKRELKWLKRW